MFHSYLMKTKVHENELYHPIVRPSWPTPISWAIQWAKLHTTHFFYQRNKWRKLAKIKLPPTKLTSRRKYVVFYFLWTVMTRTPCMYYVIGFSMNRNISKANFFNKVQNSMRFPFLNEWIRSNFYPACKAWNSLQCTQ